MPVQTQELRFKKKSSNRMHIRRVIGILLELAYNSSQARSGAAEIVSCSVANLDAYRVQKINKKLLQLMAKT